MLWITRMPSGRPRRLSVDVTWRSLFRIVGVLILAWLWLVLAQLVLLVVVAVILAVTLDPIVQRLEQHRVSRGPAATLVALTCFLLIAGFLVFAGASFVSQARLVGSRLLEVEQELVARLPSELRQFLGIDAGAVHGSMIPYAEGFVHALVSAAVVIVLAFILMLYLLIEGERTYAWLLAFVPKRYRRQVQKTATESRRVISAYAAGNIATSVFATIVVLVALSAVRVPAAPFLAILAGVCDFVPVLGFIVSSIPAVVLALTVSPARALVVAGVYIAYHLTETYYIGPLVYGNRLRLSNVVVVLAFAAGAEIAGVVGALIALPVAAVYPAIEQIWLRERLGDAVLDDHREIAKSAE